LYDFIIYLERRGKKVRMKGGGVCGAGEVDE